ncbi:hypothetical protein LCGC14_0838170 [marine sediment metagenome]|uniref:Uncharacterized protein n=1 Tax=marine sediment metagenome TaxID=412755 RepID=A0A0F9PDW2_9ZZZZ
MPWSILKENEFILGNLSIWIKAKNGTEAKKKLKKIIRDLKKKGIKIDTSETETIIGKDRDYIW